MLKAEFEKTVKDASREALIKIAAECYKRVPKRYKESVVDEFIRMELSSPQERKKAAKQPAIKKAELKDAITACCDYVRHGTYYDDREKLRLHGRSWNTDLRAILEAVAALGPNDPLYSSLAEDMHTLADVLAANYNDGGLPGAREETWFEKYGINVYMQAIDCDVCTVKSAEDKIAKAFIDFVINPIHKDVADPHSWTSYSFYSKDSVFTVMACVRYFTRQFENQALKPFIQAMTQNSLGKVVCMYLGQDTPENIKLSENFDLPVYRNENSKRKAVYQSDIEKLVHQYFGVVMELCAQIDQLQGGHEFLWPCLDMILQTRRGFLFRTMENAGTSYYLKALGESFKQWLPTVGDPKLRELLSDGRKLNDWMFCKDHEYL